MKVFCTRCGTPMEIEPSAASSAVRCAACGNQFSALPGPAASAPKRGMGAGWIVLIVLGVMAVPCVGILAAIAIPNFIRFQARSKQAECKSNLKALYTAQRAYYAEFDQYEPRLAKVGFAPAPNNRYAYFAGPDQALQGEEATSVGVDLVRFPSAQAGLSPPALLAGGLPLGVSGSCPECEFTGACLGNIDGDSTFDVWSISTADRTTPDGQFIQAGQLHNDLSDLEQ